MSPPKILLTFADHNLPELVAERQGIEDALRPARDRGSIEVESEPNARVEYIFTQFGRYPGRIALFHYGGHASRATLQLQAVGGSVETAHADGLASFLGRQDGLLLVFLNGCATAGQVEQLLRAGVKAVIATAAPVDDTMARTFALRFYASLGAGATIGAAFKDAAQEIATRWGAGAPAIETRDADLDEDRTPVDPATLWGLYTRPDASHVLGWKLPSDDARAFVFRAAPVSDGDRSRVNTALAKAVFEAAEPFSDTIATAVMLAARKGRQLPEREVRSAVIDSFPAPIGEQLRKLFGDETIGPKRLEQLLVTYTTLVRLLAFTLLAQAWDALRDKPDTPVTPDDRAILAGFAGLGPADHEGFDYFPLIAAAARVLTAAAVHSFMPETQGIEARLAEPPLADAHAFLQEMRRRQTGIIAAEDVESFCLQTEAHLTTCLCAFAFLTKYRLAAVKEIAVRRSRLDPQPRYVQKRVMLDRANDQYLDEEEESTFLTDNASVVLFGDDPGDPRWLNVSPFVIDENALRGLSKTKLYFFSHADSGRDVFALIGKAGETLAVDGSNFPLVGDLLADFRQRVMAA